MAVVSIGLLAVGEWGEGLSGLAMTAAATMVSIVVYKELRGARPLKVVYVLIFVFLALGMTIPRYFHWREDRRALAPVRQCLEQRTEEACSRVTGPCAAVEYFRGRKPRVCEEYERLRATGAIR
jgi:hypothetical protein